MDFLSMNLQELLLFLENDAGYFAVENGVQYHFHVLADLSLPCPVCYIPACGLEVTLWANVANKNLAISFDRSELDTFIDAYMSNVTPTYFAEKYYDFPVFMQEWHEGKGWYEFYDTSYYQIEPTDIINALQLINDYVPYLDDWNKERFLKYYYPTFSKFLEMVIENNAVLYICNPSSYILENKE